MTGSPIRLKGLTKHFGRVTALESLDLDVTAGEFVVLVGPSGAGKSTVLRLVAGLDDSTSGRIEIGALDVAQVPARERDVAMVFQDYALYPHMTVAKNIGYALRVRGVPPAERTRRVREAARLVGIEPQLDRRPGTLSGGQRQRVALARAIVRSPSVFLMDEPLSNLDAPLRAYMRAELRALQERLQVTTLYVTHDQTEAMTMSDRLAVLSEGRLQQYGKPQDLYDLPANVFVAGFLGSPGMRFLTGTVTDGTLNIGDAQVDLTGRQGLPSQAAVIVGVRPEDIDITSPDEQGALRGHIRTVEPLGNETILHVSVPIPAPELPELAGITPEALYLGGDQHPRASERGTVLVARSRSRRRFRLDEHVGLHFLPSPHLFSADSHGALASSDQRHGDRDDATSTGQIAPSGKGSVASASDGSAAP